MSNQINQSSTPIATQKASPVQGQESSKGQVDPILLAFMLILESATTNSQAAILRSKQLQGNAEIQERLNKEAADLKWYSLPKEEVNKHSTRMGGTGAKTRWSWEFWKNGFHYNYKNVTWQTVKNQGMIDRAEGQNQEVTSERQTISDKLRVLQQESQINETGVNSQVQDSMQSLQEGTYLLDLLGSLTFKALLHPEPQD